MKYSTKYDFYTIDQLVAEIESVANEITDGHYTICSFSSNYRGCFGSPTGDFHRINQVRAYISLRALLTAMLLDPSYFDLANK